MPAGDSDEALEIFASSLSDVGSNVWFYFSIGVSWFG
jgi:hypothetical protein